METVRLDILLNKSLKDRLEKMSEESGLTVTHIVRLAIAVEVGQYEMSKGLTPPVESDTDNDGEPT